MDKLLFGGFILVNDFMSDVGKGDLSGGVELRLDLEYAGAVVVWGRESIVELGGGEATSGQANGVIFV